MKSQEMKKIPIVKSRSIPAEDNWLYLVDIRIFENEPTIVI